MGGKACDHQDMGAEPQTSEVEIVLLGVPRRESEKRQASRQRRSSLSGRGVLLVKPASAYSRLG